MSTVLAIYQHLCREDRFPSADVTDPKRRTQRQQNLKTSVRYLAESHGSTAERLELTPDVEATYKDRLHRHLVAQGKRRSTVRNTINDIGQLLRIWHGLPPKTPIMQAPLRNARWRETTRAMNAASPYAHNAWMVASPYGLLMEQWPAEIRTRFKTFQERRRDRNRPATLKLRRGGLERYLGYLGMTGEARLEHLPAEARTKLELKRYADDLETITAVPQTLAWQDLFPVDHVRSFVTWHAWRAHTPKDAQVRERPPSKSTWMGKVVGETVLRLAQTFARKRDITALADYLRHLPEPRPMHNKKAPYHRFTHAELEQVALTLMEEARQMQVVDKVEDHRKYPGALPASRFWLGLVLMLGWRIPIRRRNWVEALLDTHLLHVDGKYRWHFEGEDLKIGTRHGQTNVFDIEIPADVVPYLEEYLHRWRPRLPHAQTDRHLLLSRQESAGGMLNAQTLRNKLLLHVYRLTGKRLSPHTLRTLFVSHAITAGLDVNSVAFVMNDTPKTVLLYYNEMYGEQEQAKAQDFYRRALNGGPLPALSQSFLREPFEV